MDLDSCDTDPGYCQGLNPQHCFVVRKILNAFSERLPCIHPSFPPGPQYPFSAFHNGHQSDPRIVYSDLQDGKQTNDSGTSALSYEGSKDII